MPQLDKVTFLSQFFWSTFFFAGFYFLVLKYALPQISRILKLRSKKINSSQEGAVSLVDENMKVRGSYDLLVANGLNTSRNVFQQSNEQIENWLNNTYIQSKGHYQKADKSYLQSVGISLLSEKLPASFLSTTNKTEKLLLIALLKKLNGKHFKPQKEPYKSGEKNHVKVHAPSKQANAENRPPKQKQPPIMDHLEGTKKQINSSKNQLNIKNKKTDLSDHTFKPQPRVSASLENGGKVSKKQTIQPVEKKQDLPNQSSIGKQQPETDTPIDSNKNKNKNKNKK